MLVRQARNYKPSLLPFINNTAQPEWRQEATVDTTPAAENLSAHNRKRPSLFTTTLDRVRSRIPRRSDIQRSHTRSSRSGPSSLSTATWKKFRKALARLFVPSQGLLNPTDSRQSATARSGTFLAHNVREDRKEGLFCMFTDHTDDDLDTDPRADDDQSSYFSVRTCDCFSEVSSDITTHFTLINWYP